MSFASKLLPLIAALAAIPVGRAQAPAAPTGTPPAGQNAAAAGGAAGAQAGRGGGRGGAPRIVGGVGDINRDDPAYANFDWAPKLDFVKVRTPADEQKAFILQQGYKMDPVLTDVDGGIKEPTSIAFDGNGRMFVMEDRGYMLTIDAQHQREPNGLISMHEDTNSDGVYDKHTVFIDKLVFPRFMLPYGPNTLLVMETDQDEIWKYTDTNNDGVADKKELFVAGVGQSGNVEHQQGLLMEAMDNWLYMTVKAFRLRQLPNGTVLRETTGSNGAQWGVSQDNDGKLWFQGGASGVPSYFQFPIVYGNFSPGAQWDNDFTIPWGAPIRIMDAQQGMKDVRMPDGSLTRVTGSAGSNIVRANRMPADLQGDYLYNEPVARIVRRIHPTVTEGVTTLKNYYDGNEFVKSTDPLFRPVNLATAPDGTIYVVDMYRGIIQESTWSAPINTYLRARVDEYGLDRFTSMGRIWRLSYNDLPRDKTMPKMNTESAAQLVTHLSHPNGWWRDTAQQLLVLKQDKSVVPALKKIVNAKENLVARFHALWTLEGLSSLDAALVRQSMQDPEPRMRIQAIRVSETLYKAGDKSFAADYAKLATDKDGNVATQALLTMNLLKTPDVATVAKASLDSNKYKSVQLVANQIVNPAAAGAGRGGRGGQAGPTLDAAQQASVTRGQATFNELCSQCHGLDATGAMKPDNSGKLAPSLANNPRINGHRDWILNVLVAGLTGQIPGSDVKDIMVPMGSNSDQWIADVASYVRTSFGNTGNPVTPEQVAVIRATTSKGRTAPWTFAELDAKTPKLPAANLADWKVSASHNEATARNAISPFNTWSPNIPAAQQQQAASIWLQVELPSAINLAEVQFTSAAPAAGRGGAGAGGRAGAAGAAGGRAGGGAVAADAAAQVLPAVAPAAAPVAQPAAMPAAREFRVEVSTNGTTWTPVGVVQGVDGAKTLALSQPTSAKFVRIAQVQGAPALTLSALRLYELGASK